MKTLCTAFLLSLAAAPLLAASDACVAVPGTPGESVWSFSAAQTLAGDLVILDSLQDRLLRLPSGGSALTPVTGPAAERLPDVRPVLVRSLPEGGLLLQLATTRTFAQLDRSFELQTGRARGLHHAARADGGSIESAWIWQPVTADELVTCSDLYLPSRSGEREAAAGLVRVSLGRPGGFDLLLRTPLDSPLHFACRLSLPLIAVRGDGSVYALVPGDTEAPGGDLERTRIYRAGPGGGRLAPLAQLPDRLGRWPRLPADAGYDQLPEVMRQIERAAMPIGLFADGDWLYLLSRSPLRGGATRWELTRIDPADGRAAGTMNIASAANHLMVVPGREDWALIEKGPVLSFGHQELHRIVRMPVEQLSDWRDGGTLCSGL